MRTLLLAVPLATLLACSSSAVGGSPSEPAAPATTEPKPLSTLAVARSPITIAPIRDHHTTHVIETASGAWLYVIGGTDSWSVLHNDVQRAKIGEDGSLGAFEAAGNLPDQRAGHCTVKAKDKLYVLGGVTTGSVLGPTATSVVLTLDADGKVAGTAAGPALPKPVMHLTCELVGETVYAFGGRGADSKSTTMSARATIGADGTLSAFEDVTPLTPDRSHHASFVRDGRVYLVGGLTGDPTGEIEEHTDIVFADLAGDGSLGAWTPAGSLPKAISVSAAQLYEDAVYVPGGLSGQSFSSDVRRATFHEDGTLTEFETLDAKLPSPRGHVHQIPVYKTWFFSVGGKDNKQRSLGQVDIGSFTAAP